MTTHRSTLVLFALISVGISYASVAQSPAPSPRTQPTDASGRVLRDSSNRPLEYTEPARVDAAMVLPARKAPAAAAKPERSLDEQQSTGVSPSYAEVWRTTT